MTLAAFLFAALPAQALPHHVGTLDVADTTTAYLRSLGKGEAPAFDLDTAPEVSATLAFRRTQLRADYAPRLTLRDVAHDDSRDLFTLHNAAAALRYLGRRTMLTAGQTLSVGTQYFSNLGTAGIPAQTGTGEAAVPTSPIPTPGAQLLPGVASLRLWSQQSFASIEHRFTPRWSSEVRGSFAIAGGRGEREQLLLPRRREGNASMGLGYRVTRRHMVSSIGTFSRVLVSNGFEHWLAGLGEDWDMRWTRNLRASVNAGGIWRRTLRPDGSERSSVVPDVGAGLTYETRHGRNNFAFDANGAVTPFVNTLTGQFQTVTRGMVAGKLRWRDTTCSLQADAYQTLPANEDFATRLIGGGLNAAQDLTEWLVAGVGARLQYQRVEGTEFNLPLWWSLSASLRVQVPTLHF